MNIIIEVKHDCPACGSAKHHNQGNNGGIVYRVCQSCGHRYKTVQICLSDIASIEMKNRPPIQLSEIRNKPI